ncbi:hypothetical protein SERLADRAFT_433363 [Serpula lacrymans var. lacrymans S7.9]|uniref:Uncharacterized protein n=1 Tax=Serpula lacrymans var. lacrymans (strain S7.9) TaxID=578457 RepID=F8NGI6_SERL9|nr:uncharacterized protein SERLADRAFT_433363 [Serpula lacrymans var. lacrymans S7.9]EGO29373.1 hypothetical protein SERLADRAFT_433363 [Serpula lacrymans var. lacrymans S7.9]
MKKASAVDQMRRGVMSEVLSINTPRSTSHRRTQLTILSKATSRPITHNSTIDSHPSLFVPQRLRVYCEGGDAVNEAFAFDIPIRRGTAGWR